MLKVVPIHTSDRIQFKRCRRKWNWNSLIREGRQPIQSPGPLWYGSGFHFALEDFHGENKYGDPVLAFDAYVKAYRIAGEHKLPDNWEELVELGHDMLGYYVKWLKSRTPLNTFMYKGVPQVEVPFEIPIPIRQELIDKYNASRAEGQRISGVVYRGCIDKVIIDDNGFIWPLDYKTAKAFVTNHFETDPQITAYMWAMESLYPGVPVGGFVYQQHKKTAPDYPKFLKSTKKYSTSKTQATSKTLYREALINLYGSLDKAPTDNFKFLNFLAGQETSNADQYIRRDFVTRNETQLYYEGQKIIQEAEDMINPDLPLYPNPTRDCSWDCSYHHACILMDAGGDVEGELEFETELRTERDETWRNYL